jgi:hypothetical protein
MPKTFLMNFGQSPPYVEQLVQIMVLKILGCILKPYKIIFTNFNLTKLSFVRKFRPKTDSLNWPQVQHGLAFVVGLVCPQRPAALLNADGTVALAPGLQPVERVLAGTLGPSLQLQPGADPTTSELTTTALALYAVG